MQKVKSKGLWGTERALSGSKRKHRDSPRGNCSSYSPDWHVRVRDSERGALMFNVLLSTAQEESEQQAPFTLLCQF